MTVVPTLFQLVVFYSNFIWYTYPLIWIFSSEATLKKLMSVGPSVCMYVCLSVRFIWTMIPKTIYFCNQVHKVWVCSYYEYAFSIQAIKEIDIKFFCKLFFSFNNPIIVNVGLSDSLICWASLLCHSCSLYVNC